MHAVILAGGMGTRLRPYTIVLPKPLMPVGEYPILEVVVRQLAKYGFSRATFAVNHQADLIRAYFGDGRKWGIDIDYSLEREPLGTMGPLKLISHLPENFLVMNGDILTDLNFNTFYFDHLSSGSIFSISSYERTQKVDYGVLKTDEYKSLLSFTEKPEYYLKVSMGVYMANRDILNHIPNGFFGFDNLMHSLIKDRCKVSVCAHKGYWLDIGRPDDYMQAIDEFEQLKSKFL